VTRRIHPWVIVSLFSVLCPVLATTLLFLARGGYNPTLLSDYDEFYYLVLPGRVTLEQVRLPHELLDIALGGIIRLFQIPNLLLPFILDIICSVLAFCGLYALFMTMGRSRSPQAIVAASAAAVFVTLLPWSLSSVLLSLDRYLAFSDLILTSSHGGFPSTPVERGLYTQISWVVWTWALCLLAKVLVRRTVSWLDALLIALLLGSTIYIYFFCWAALWFVFVCAVVLDLGLAPREWSCQTRMRLLAAAVLGVCIATPGLVILFPAGGLFSPGPDRHLLQDTSGVSFRSVWFFAPTVFILTIGVGMWLRRDAERRVDAPHRVPLVLAWACLLGELVLMNAQPLLNRWLTPYHFPLFFFHPALTALLIFAYLSRTRLYRVAAVIILSIGPIIGIIRVMSYPGGAGPEAEVLRYIDERLPAGAPIYTMPFIVDRNTVPGDISHLMMPFWIDAMTHADSASRVLGYDSNRADVVRREMTSAWVLTGRASLLAGCPQVPISLHGNDIMNGTRTYFLMQRAIDCRVFDEIEKAGGWKPVWTPGTHLFVVLRRGEMLTNSAASNVLELFRSSDGMYTVLRLTI